MPVVAVAPPAAVPAAARHPHLAAAVPTGHVRVDMHLHTMWSGDATTTPEELRAAVAESGIDVLCITDHGTTNGARQLLAEGTLGCRVVIGQEVRTGVGEIIGLFLSSRIPAGLKPEEVCVAIAAQGGLVYIPHPFDPMRACLREDVLLRLVGDGLVDAIEVRNAKTSLEHLNARAARFAVDHGLAAGAGSDAHEPMALGAAYMEMPDFIDGDAASFLSGLQAGVVVGHHYDAPRRWMPRIVPSTKST
jgi:predicted metal-dependent phosphoesterase TrpH